MIDRIINLKENSVIRGKNACMCTDSSTAHGRSTVLFMLASPLPPQSLFSLHNHLLSPSLRQVGPSAAPVIPNLQPPAGNRHCRPLRRQIRAFHPTPSLLLAAHYSTSSSTFPQISPLDGALPLPRRHPTLPADSTHHGHDLQPRRAIKTLPIASSLFSPLFPELRTRSTLAFSRLSTCSARRHRPEPPPTPPHRLYSTAEAAPSPPIALSSPTSAAPPPSRPLPICHPRPPQSRHHHHRLRCHKGKLGPHFSSTNRHPNPILST